MNALVIGASAILVLLMYAALTRPKEVLYAAIFFLPWRGLDPYFFLGLSFSRILIAVVGVASLMQVSKNRHRARIPRSLLFFILYCVAISAARAPFLPHVDVAGGEMREPTNRALLQILYFLAILVLPLIIFPKHLNTGQDCIKAVKVFLLSLGTLATLGWIQLAVWYATGFNLFPVGLIPSFFGDFQKADASFAMAGLDLHRMCSLAGEPKDLGQALAVGLLVVQAILTGGVPRKQERMLRWCWVFLFFSMAMTYSTSAVFLWVIGTGIEALALLPRPGNSGGLWHTVRNANMVVILGAAVLIGMFSYLGVNGGSVGQIARGRTVERMGLEDFDQAALGFLEENPVWAIFGTGMGNIHLYANDYLSPVFAAYASGTVFRPKTGLIRIISELGVVGLLAWLVAIFAQLRNLLNASRLARGTRRDSRLPQLAGSVFIALLALAVANFAVSMDEFLYPALALALAINSIASLSFGTAPRLYYLKRHQNVDQPSPSTASLSA